MPTCEVMMSQFDAKNEKRQSVMFVHIKFILIVPATKWECMNTLKQHKNVATIRIQYLQNIQTTSPSFNN